MKMQSLNKIFFDISSHLIQIYIVSNSDSTIRTCDFQKNGAPKALYSFGFSLFLTFFNFTFIINSCCMCNHEVACDKSEDEIK